jgi:membrane protein implicated in regulation of membrane protease activity
MDFDQMLEIWRAQDAAPLYGVNRDALRHALQTEDARVRRVQRRDMWIVCLGGVGTAVLGAFWVAICISKGWPAIYTVAAGVGFAMVALWLGAYCVSRWRQAKSERNFGNTLQGEVRRTLSRIDIEILRFGHWTAATLQIAPIVVGAMLISWSVGRSQSVGHDDPSGGRLMYLIVALFMVYVVRRARRNVKQKLEPRQRRLRELLSALDARE